MEFEGGDCSTVVETGDGNHTTVVETGDGDCSTTVVESEMVIVLLL